MTTTLQATFDGKVFVPSGAVDLKAGEVVELQISTAARTSEKTPMQLLAEKWAKEPLESSAPEDYASNKTLGTFLDQFADDPATPTDGAAQHDHYLYGTPKRENP